MMESSSEHKAQIVRAFTQQAQSYAANSLVANPDRLAALVQAAHPEVRARVLDVATGPGHVAAAFAEAGCEVIGIDLTSAPLSFAEQMRASRGLSTLHFQQGDAQKLPYSNGNFDIVVSRYALHHVEDPHQVLSEMARVCRSQGKVVIQDLIASEFPARATYQNHIELLRDPSHTRALPISQLLSLFTSCGLETEQVVTDTLVQNLETWLANAHTAPELAAQVRTLVQRDEQENLSGTYPFQKEGGVFFNQRIVTVIARNIDSK
jgi:ubiquinone/menaquinone biosynthesis C-methylase UbiE